MSLRPSQAGREWLADCDLPVYERALVESDLRLMTSVNEEIGTQEQQLQQEAWNIPRVRLLMTIPGVGYGTALTLMAALGDLSRFENGDRAASYLGLTPSIKQSANTCHYGPITKRGNTHARWMLTQSAQNMARHPGPLGVFIRRLAKRKSWNVAVCATARKLVVIAWLMLKHNEPYRYASPNTTQQKLSRLRVAVTGRHRKAEHKGRRPGVKNGANPPSRLVPSLGCVCEQEGLPRAHGFEQLPAGEQRVLKSLGVIDYIQQISTDRRTPRPRKLRTANVSREEAKKS